LAVNFSHEVVRQADMISFLEQVNAVAVELNFQFCCLPLKDFADLLLELASALEFDFVY